MCHRSTVPDLAPQDPAALSIWARAGKGHEERNHTRVVGDRPIRSLQLRTKLGPRRHFERCYPIKQLRDCHGDNVEAGCARLARADDEWAKKVPLSVWIGVEVSGGNVTL